MSNSKLFTLIYMNSNLGLWALGCVLWAMDCVYIYILWTMRYGHVGYGLWITDYASAFLFRAAGELPL